VPDHDDVLRGFARARDRLSTHEREVSELRAGRAQLEVEHTDAVRSGATARAESLGELLSAADERLSLRIRERIGILQDLVDLSGELVAERTPEQLVGTLDGGVPVAMLPVRIETRFDGPTKMRVRIFPDQIHIDAHDPAVTIDEAEGARWYWERRWHAGLDDNAAAHEAWTGLVARFRPGRAAYLVAAFTPADGRDANPVFPDVPLRESAWSRPAVATALPDRFCVVGFTETPDGWVERFRKWGSALPDRIPVAPDPHAMAGPPAPGRLPIDEGTAWTRDPSIARDRGMLIDVEHPALADGVDRLVVVGVDWTMKPQDAASALERLLQNQRHAAHLQFVSQGTPTNNTGAGPAAYSSNASAEAALLDPARPPAPADDPTRGQSAGVLLARALGLTPEALTDVPGADIRDQAWASALTDVLWRATAGFYIQDLLDPLGNDASLASDDPHIDADLRDFISKNVLPSGPLPTLRVGTQPYGVLPVVASRRYAPSRRTERLVHGAASTIRRIVAPALPDIPHLRRAGEDQDVDTVLLALLQRTPVPWSFAYRGLTGPVERKNVGTNWAERHAFQNTWTSLIWKELGVKVSPRLSELTLGDRHPLNVPLVAGPPENTMGYLAEIAKLTIHPQGRSALNLRENSQTLLEALAAVSAVDELDRCALQYARDAVAITPEQLVQLPALRNLHIATPDSVRVEAAPAIAPALLDFRSGRQLADAIVPQISATMPLGTVITTEFAKVLPNLAELLGAPTDPFYWLARFRTGLDTLSNAPIDDLEWAFRGHLSIYSTRLDAWFTGLANARLAEHRASEPTGVHIGCWGFVENLRRDVGAGAESLGFVHAPSQAQAVSAALLRNGRLADRSTDGEVFDLQLTSEQVRRARWLLDGIAQGQRLAALLGYRIERRLRDEALTLMRYQMPLRRTAPLRGEVVQHDEPVEVLTARDVVDGVAILDRWRQPGGPAEVLAEISANAGSMPAADNAALRRVLDDVAGEYDAVSDVLVAEAVHQAALGNTERAGAALAAHDRHGRVADLDFISAPRSGHTVAHRVIVLEQPSSDDTGWPRDTRAVAEPLLEAWAARILGSPHDWGFRAVAVDPGAAEGAPEIRTELAAVPLSRLGIGALSTALATRRAGSSAASELEQRAALLFAAEANPAPNQRLELLPGAAPNSSGGLGLLTTLGEWIADVARCPAATATDFRAADAPDVAAAEAGSVDVAELVGRAKAIHTRLDTVRANLEQATTPTEREGALLESVPFDGPDAIPQTPRNHPNAETEIAVQVTEVLGRIRTMATTVAETVALPVPADHTIAVERYSAVLKSMLGADQPVLPRWTLSAQDSVAASIADRSALLQGDTHAAISWLHRSSLVRPDLDPLAGLLLHHEAAGADVSAALVVIQQPHRPDASWHALPFPSDAPPPNGSLGVVVHSTRGFRPGRAFAGVIVDAWTETIPQTSETTAVSFHYDAPGARPPQTMLLAVHPEANPGAWSLDLLLDTVNEAADLARVRMLSSKELSVLGSFLPALYLPDDYTHDVPSVSFWKLQNIAGLADAAASVLGKQ
jgi:hypothetical protein